MRNTPVGPKSLEWCRRNIRQYAELEALSKKVRAEQEQNRKMMKEQNHAV